MESICSIITQKKNMDKKHGGLLNSKINGFTKVTNEFLARKDLNIYEKMTIIILSKYKMNKSYCWPAIKTIATEVGCSENTVKKSIKNLNKMNLLKIEKNGRYKTNIYRPKMRDY